VLKKLLSGLVRAKRGYDVDEVYAAFEARDIDGAERMVEALHEHTPDRELFQECLRAHALFFRHRDEEAQALLESVLSKRPNFVEAYHLLSAVHVEAGRTEEAVGYAQFAHTYVPKVARYAAQYGYSLLNHGMPSMARQALTKAVSLDRGGYWAWNNLGIAALTEGDRDAARRAFLRAKLLNPQGSQARANLIQLDETEGEVSPLDAQVPGKLSRERVIESMPVAELGPAATAELDRLRAVFATAGDGEQLARACDELIAWAEHNHTHVELAACQAAATLETEGFAFDALELLHPIAEQNPKYWRVLYVLAYLYERMGDIRNALGCIDKSIEAAAESADAAHYTLKGAAHNRLDEFSLATAAFKRAFEMRPTADSCVALAQSLTNCCEYKPAIEMYERAISEFKVDEKRIRPSMILPYLFTGQIDAAREALTELLKQTPNHAHLRVIRGFLSLSDGNFADGWPDYHLRHTSGAAHFRTVPIPRWRGESLENKRVLVLAEQGLGDQVMFASCLPDLLAQKPAVCCVEVVSRVAKTLERSFPSCRFVPTQQNIDFDWLLDIEPFDLHLYIGDLPLYFRPDIASFPATSYLHADAGRVAYWRAQIANRANGRRAIGVSWRGGSEKTRAHARTIEPHEFATLSTSSDVLWVNLQYGDTALEREALAAAGMDLCHWQVAIDDLDEFAALIMALDQVVSVCNTTVHYAGALGKPCLVLAPLVPEWRYGLRGTKMPWYSSVEMLRQSEIGSWLEPLASARAYLDQRGAAPAMT
jgi:tetratricopeptide (TPR) repeat protein